VSPMSEAALEAWGRSIGARAVAGEALPLVLALRGPLGAGKSVLARAVARGAGVDGPMPSPTYNLRFTYPGRDGVEVDHLDLYRIEDPDDVWELAWDTLGEGSRIVLIEWPERAEALLPPDRWDVTLSFGAADDPSAHAFRRVELTRQGKAPDIPPPAGPPGSVSGQGP